MRTSSTVRIAAAALIAPALLFTAACSSGDATADGGSAKPTAEVNTDAPLYDQLPEAVQQAGVLNAASYIGYPPFEYYDEDNETVIGLDRDLADAIEQQIGVPIVYHNVPFDSIVPGLAAKRYDLAMSAMSDTLERQEQVDFLDYFMNGEAILTTKENPKKIGTITDLCGITVGGVKGTTGAEKTDIQSEECVAEGKPAVDHTVFPGQNEAVLALQNGRVEAVVLGYSTGGYIAQTSNDALAITPPFQMDGPFGIVFPKGSEELMAAFTKSLEAIEADGTYDKILAEYGQSDAAIDKFVINGATH
ncbi:ABC transporter substrate-binding protein [Leucobacter chromiireducens]|uniref:ABC transporter substrate-binding protein n=1 Tax=Leucobacter chromiireducens subsp. solipictus TaxID=398235 RepID=A0ABS1SEZ0_9MICO|nr:ABC transporter substrate-binding protein [Leucobacter chromiireducens]MBL3679119.1 ABC transporter substrate-binding protein [Leucobacter chromiireducens subsp. solipictus]